MFVAGLALRRPCLRRAGALHGSEIQVEQGLLFVALVLVLLAEARDFPEDFHIEALSLGLCEDFLLALIQRLDLFVDAFNALDEGANAIAWDSCRVCVLPLSKRAQDIAMKVTEKLIEPPRIWLKRGSSTRAVLDPRAHNRVAITDTYDRFALMV